MKKFLLATAVLGASLGANAQDSYKFESGDKNLEVQFAPLSGSPVSISGVRLRLFNSESSAIRANFFLGYGSETSITQQENTDTKALELKDRSTNFTLNIRPGYEKHFAGTERLSPYIGGELDIAYSTSAERTEAQAGEDKINYTRTANADQSGYFRIGANAVAGADYYFAKKAYLGVEMGYGLSYVSFLKQRVKSDIDGFKPEENGDGEKQGSSFDFAPNFNAMLRLGYCF